MAIFCAPFLELSIFCCCCDGVIHRQNDKFKAYLLESKDKKQKKEAQAIAHKVKARLYRSLPEEFKIYLEKRKFEEVLKELVRIHEQRERVATS